MASQSPVLSLPHFRNLSKNWYFATSEAILKGNNIHDKHIASPGTRLDVEEVKHLKQSLTKMLMFLKQNQFGCHHLLIPLPVLLILIFNSFLLKKGKSLLYSYVTVAQS